MYVIRKSRISLQIFDYGWNVCSVLKGTRYIYVTGLEYSVGYIHCQPFGRTGTAVNATENIRKYGRHKHGQKLRPPLQWRHTNIPHSLLFAQRIFEKSNTDIICFLTFDLIGDVSFIKICWTLTELKLISYILSTRVGSISNYCIFGLVVDLVSLGDFKESGEYTTYH